MREDLSKRVVPEFARRKFLWKVVALVVAMAIVVAVVGVVTMTTVSEEVQEQRREDLQAGAQEEAESLAGWRVSQQKRVGLLSENDEFENPDGRSDVETTVANQAARFPESLYAIHYVTGVDWRNGSTSLADAEIAVSSREALEGESLAVEGMAWRDGFRFENDNAVDESRVYANDGEELIAFASPVENNDVVMVVVVDATERADTFRTSIDGGYTQVVDSRGEVQFGADTGETLSQYSDTNNIEELQRGVDGESGVLERDGDVIAYAPVANADWVVVKRGPKTNAYAVPRLVRERIGVLVGVFLLGLLALTVSLRRGVVSDVEELTADARAVADGDLERDVRERDRIDEVGTLFAAVSEMRDSLRDRIDQAETARADAMQAARELARNQRFLEQTQAVANVGGWEVDRTAAGMRWTDEVYDIYGVDADFDPDVETVVDLYHPDDRETVEAAFERATDEGDPFDVEVRVTRPDGEVAWTRTRGEPWREDGDIVGLRGTVQDVTERKQREKQLEKSNERLEQFAYVASHDLQEPLRTVSNYTEILATDYVDELDDEAQRFIDVVMTSSERMQEMINGLLDYSRVTTRGDAFEPVDTEAVVRDVVDDLQFMLDEHEGSVEIGDLPTAEADSSQLHRLFQNLMKNALEHSGDDAVDIEVRGREDPHQYRFEVEDDGPGIAESRQEKIFRIFKSEEQDQTSPEVKGLGLAICDNIVRRHRGDIWVESEPGAGSTFVFTIDKNKQDEAQ